MGLGYSDFKHFWVIWSCFIILEENNVGRRNSFGMSGKDSPDAFEYQQMEDCFASVEGKLPEVLAVLLWSALVSGT